MKEIQKIITDAYENFQKGLNTYAFFKVSNLSTSKDLVQETFIKTWRYLVKGGEINTMKAFLYHVLNKLIINEYRKRKLMSLETLTERGFEIVAESSNSIFDMFDKNRVLVLLKKLPLNYQKLIHMRYMQDLSLKEMALITGQTKNNLAVQLHRGLQKIKLLYSKEYKLS